MLKRTFVAVSIAALPLAGLAIAQESATVTLRSGEQLSGQLVDMGGVGFTVRVSGQERQIPTGEIALINFSGGSMSDSDWNDVTNGQHVLWLKSGERIIGQLTDIGGAVPLRISFRTSSGDRDYSSNDVSRIALARPAGVSGTGTTGSSGGQGISVSAQQQWTPTGIALRKGDWITLNTTGEINVGNNEMAPPTGVRNQRFDPRAPLPNVLLGALIGRVGNGRPFGIGNSTRIQAPDSGQLFLGVNDSGLGDNQGAFQVEVRREGGPIRR